MKAMLALSGRKGHGCWLILNIARSPLVEAKDRGNAPVRILFIDGRAVGPAGRALGNGLQQIVSRHVGPSSRIGTAALNGACVPGGRRPFVRDSCVSLLLRSDARSASLTLTIAADNL
jgi:hypothetical protein